MYKYVIYINIIFLQNAKYVNAKKFLYVVTTAL
jgi:hypothetical protein